MHRQCMHNFIATSCLEKGILKVPFVAGIVLNCVVLGALCYSPAAAHAGAAIVPSAMPDRGTPNQSQGSFQQEFPGNPVIGGASFDALGDVVRALLKPGSDTSVQRFHHWENHATCFEALICEPRR
jgi:hypothetical protein